MIFLVFFSLLFIRYLLLVEDTQNNNASQNDLQTANSPLAMFFNSNNFNTVRTVQETNVSGSKKVQNPVTPQAYNSILQSHQQQQQKQSLPIKTKNIPSNGTNGNGGAKETTKLITPNMLVVQSNNNNTNNNNINIKGGDKKQPEPLTKNQMIQALKYLIENDDDFTKKVHDAYLKSLKN